MKLAVITDEIDTDLAHALDVMAEYDIHHAELRAIDNSSIASMTCDEVHAIKQLLDSKGAHAIGIASPFFKTDLPGTGTGINGPLHGAAALGFDDQLPLLERLIQSAKILGAPFIRTFTFWKHGTLTQEIEDRIVEAYLEPAHMAERAGITLIVENEPSCYTSTATETARIVSRIASPAVKIVWDPGNAVFTDEAPFPNGYAAVKPYMAHVHVKDAKPNLESVVECVVIGEGDANWPAQLAALAADNYTGYLSLETHYNGLMNKEASSRQCLEALQHLLKAV